MKMTKQPEQATSTTITFCQEGVTLEDIMTTLEKKFNIQFYTGLGNTNHIVKISKDAEKNT